MIRTNFCPKCQQVTNQKTTKTLQASVTKCEQCSTTLKLEYTPRKPLQTVKRVYNPVTKKSYPVKEIVKTSDEIKSLWKTPLKKVSAKMAVQRRGEKKLEQKLLELCQNRCEICNQSADFRGLHKHEIIRRGQQGNELEPTNCLILCLRCHDHNKYPLTGTPLSIINQQDLAKKLHAGVK